MNFTLAQKLTIATGVIGAATSAFGALNSIMTPTEALIGTVLLGFTSACLGVIGTVLSSQSAQVKAVGAITGDDGKPALRINVNANAPQAVAAAAVDPAQPNVGAANSDVRAALVTKAAS